MDIGDDTDARHVTLGTVMARPRHMSPRHAPLLNTHLNTDCPSVSHLGILTVFFNGFSKFDSDLPAEKCPWSCLLFPSKTQVLILI